MRDYTLRSAPPLPHDTSSDATQAVVRLAPARHYGVASGRLYREVADEVLVHCEWNG
jgi:hypothetical protein